MKFKTVWIIGASSGIGNALARAFAKRGSKVLISARNVERLNSLQKEFPNLIHVLPLDITSDTQRINAITEAQKWSSSIDLIIHSAGVSQRAKAENTSVDVVKRLFDINFFGLIELNRLALPLLKSGSRIAVISSLVGKFATPYRTAYAASKHALDGYFEGLRYELAEKGIAISMIYPGYVHTEISQNALKADGSSYQKLDETQAKGISAEESAKKIIHGLLKGKDEFFFGGSELIGVYLKRFFPQLLKRIVAKRNITFEE